MSTFSRSVPTFLAAWAVALSLVGCTGADPIGASVSTGPATWAFVVDLEGETDLGSADLAGYCYIQAEDGDLVPYDGDDFSGSKCQIVGTITPPDAEPFGVAFDAPLEGPAWRVGGEVRTLAEGAVDSLRLTVGLTAYWIEDMDDIPAGAPEAFLTVEARGRSWTGNTSPIWIGARDPEGTLHDTLEAAAPIRGVHFTDDGTEAPGWL